MTEQENAIKKESNTDEWLMGCTMCDEGLCNFIDKLMVDQKVNQSKAIKIATDLANEKIGTDFFNPGTIKKKYYRTKGMIDTVPKKKTEKKVPQKQDKVVQSTPTLQETSEPKPESNIDELTRNLIDSIKSIVVGLKAFNEGEDLTQDQDLKVLLQIALVDIIPEAKTAMKRINSGE